MVAFRISERTANNLGPMVIQRALAATGLNHLDSRANSQVWATQWTAIGCPSFDLRS